MIFIRCYYKFSFSVKAQLSVVAAIALIAVTVAAVLFSNVFDMRRHRHLKTKICKKIFKFKNFGMANQHILHPPTQTVEFLVFR